MDALLWSRVNWAELFFMEKCLFLTGLFFERQKESAPPLASTIVAWQSTCCVWGRPQVVRGEQDPLSWRVLLARTEHVGPLGGQ